MKTTMEITIIRTSYPQGTNGQLFINGKHACFTIERPWLNNRRRESCIPIGTYEIKKRWSPKHGWHLWVSNVPGRTFILIHVGNNALVDSHGCILTVGELTGIGKGIRSRVTCQAITKAVFEALKTVKVWLTIKNKTA